MYVIHQKGIISKTILQLYPFRALDNDAKLCKYLCLTRVIIRRKMMS